MRRYNIENRKEGPECMDDPTDVDAWEFGPTSSELSDVGGVLGALFITAFGTPFLGAGLFTLGQGVDILLNDGLFGLFLIFFSLPFIGVGGMVVFGGLYNIGIGIGIIKQKDTLSTPRIGTNGLDDVFREKIERPDKIQFPNPLKIEVDGKVTEFQLDNQTELSYEAIRGILGSDEFWIIHLDANRNTFFQMHIESGLIEYWTDGAMQHQQTGDIDDALKYLESIISTEENNAPEELLDIFKEKVKLSIDEENLESQLENDSKKASEDLHQSRRSRDSDRDTKSRLNFRSFVNNPVGALFFIFILFLILNDVSRHWNEELPDSWCDESVNYPVTVPLHAVYERAWDDYEPNREDGTYSDTDLVINGGVCTYRYRTGGSSVFEFEIELQEVSDIDGISMLVMPHPGGQTVGYSGLEVYTMTNNSSQWELQIDSPYMFGDYEREASHETRIAGFYFGEWFRHAFDSSVENVSHVKIVTGNADQLGDMSVSFSGLRVDAVGDYDYPDYLICSGEWDGLFENSTSDMIEWPVHDGSRWLGC